MICQSSRSYGYFAALYRVVREVPPNTTSPPPPEIEEDTGLGLPAIIALVAGGAIFLGGAIGGIYAWHLARSKKPVEPEEEEEEEVVEESESESEVKELPDPDWVNGSCNVGRLHIFLDSAAKNLWQSGSCTH